MVRFVTVVLCLLAAAPASAEEIVLWYSFRAGEADALEQIVNEFRTSHPDVRVRTLQVPFGAYPQKLRSAIPQGAGPDVFVAPNDYLRDQIERGLIVPPNAIAGGRFAPSLVDSLTIDGTTWGYPLAFKTLLLFYRRDMVKEPPTTTDELIRVAKAHTGDGKFGFVYQASAPYYHAPWLFGFGGRLFDGEHLEPFDSAPALAAADFLRRLVTDEGVTPVDVNSALATDMFNRGRTAMVMNGPWFVSEIAEGVPWAVAPLPVVSATGLPARPFASVDVLYVTPDGSRKASVNAFIDALTSDAAARVRARVGRQPSANVVVSRETADDPLLGMLARQLEATAALPTQPIMQLAWEPYEGALRQIQRGARSPQAALREAYQRVEVLSRPVPEAASAKAYGLAGLVLVAVALGLLWRFSPPGLLRRIRENGLAYAFLAPAAIGMVVLVGVPFLFGVGLGFFELAPGEVRFVGLANFASILLARDYGVFAPMSFYFTMVVTVLWTVTNIGIHLAIGFVFALALQQSWVRGRGLLRVLLIVPWAVPNYITALVFKGLFNAQLGAVNALLRAVGIAPVAWFDSFWPAFGANLVTNVWLGFPFMMVTILGALQAIPADLYEAARVDGAGPWRRFKDVTLPLVGPALVPSVVLGTIWTFNMFNVVFLVSEGQPEGATDILVTEAYRWAFLRNGRYGYAAAYSLIIFAILLLYSGLTKKLVSERVASNA